MTWLTRTIAIVVAVGAASSGCGRRDDKAKPSEPTAPASNVPARASSPSGSSPERAPSAQEATAACVARVARKPTTSTRPVMPSQPYERGRFEDFPVRHRIPAGARGLALVFHGSGGSVDFVEKVETVAVIEALLAEGFGFAATESTQRDGARRWDPSPSRDNPDLQRVERWVRHLVKENALDAETKVFPLGMSNGAVFVGTLAHYLHRDTDLKVGAAAMYGAGWRPGVFDRGAPVVPTFFVAVENETVSDAVRAREQLAQAKKERRALIVDVLAKEQRLDAKRFLRVPGVTEADAKAVFDHLVATEIIDADGTRKVELDGARKRLRRRPMQGIDPPQLRQIEHQIRVAWAVHAMRGDYAAANADFFACFR